MTAPERHSLADYLQFERAMEWKHEYVDGVIRPMPHEHRTHTYIANNIGFSLHGVLRQTPYETYMLRMRVRVGDTGLYTYPDVVVACPPIQCEDEERDTLLNPAVIIEVLSPSTEAYDRGEKFFRYRRLASLREYILVAQDAPRIERFVRQGDF
jgi:Uma2 family endonuclease